ncbi:MAG: DMT family transporter [Rhodospirillales bacterium]|nr:DMT family transporter [Rhodospirillales bacterium]
MAVADDTPVSTAAGQGASKSILPAAYGAAAFAILIWGGTPAATKFVVMGIDPVSAGVLRTILAGAIVLPFALIRRMPLPGSAREWGLLALMVLGVFVIFPLFFSFGVKQTSTSHAALINAAIPIFTGLFGAIAERRIPGRLWTFGVAVAFAGVAMLIGFRGDGSDGVTLWGDILCLLSSVGSGLGYVAGARLSMKIGSRAATFWGLSLGAVVLLPVLVIYYGDTHWGSVPTSSYVAVAYQATCSSILAFLAWYWALSKGGIVRMAPVQFSMPIISLTLAVLLFGETLSTPLLLSGVIIVVGIAISQRRRT